MKRIALILLVLQGLFFTSVSFTQNNMGTKVDFKIKNIGMNVKGTFSEVAITSNFDANKLAESFINATIEVNSIDTGISKRDKHLLESDYFDGKNFRYIKFTSSKIEKKAIDKYVLTGELTIKKTTKTIKIPLLIDESDNTISTNADFSINRRDYNIGGSSWVMANSVKISVRYSVKR